MKIPLKYTLRNFRTRRLTTAITVMGIALVVFVFTAVLMLAAGVRKTLVATGSTENIIVARKAAQGEISSIILNDTYNIILSLPQVAKGSDQRPLASGDVVVIINLPKIGTGGGISNVTVRGVPDFVMQLRPSVKIVEGRAAKPGAMEAILGTRMRGRFKGLELGQSFELRKNNEVAIVGIFEDAGSSFESEVWSDIEVVKQGFRREGMVSSVRVRLDLPS